MSHGKLREDTTCQNCGDEVKVRFCPSCGQENIETKKSFHYLFTHFLEDLVHYESSFWKALKYLLISPEKLTLTYLSGKRKAFMAPVRLFIFVNIISFVIYSTFIFKSFEQGLTHGYFENKKADEKQIEKIDSLKGNQKIEKEKEIIYEQNESYFNKKLSELDKKYTQKELFKIIIEKCFQNLPKWLFLIMPFFALILWFTHDKKKWWYFDNGIFTFHYFASFLLITSLTTIINQLFYFFKYETNEYFYLIIFIYLNFIFIKSFFKFYNENRLKSIIKLFVIYFLNSLIVLFTFILFAMYIVIIL
jgi:hypothetical protein